MCARNFDHAHISYYDGCMINTRKRVLIFSLAYLPLAGGAELAIKNITDRIGDISFDLIALRFDSSLPRREKIGNVTVHRIGFTKHHPTPKDLIRFPLYLNKVFFPILAFFKAAELHRRRPYDMVWAMMSYAGLPAVFFKFFNSRVPFLLTLQEGDSIAHITRRLRIRAVFPLYRMVFSRANFVQAISSYLDAFARSMGFTGKSEIVPNGVAIRHFSQIFNKKTTESMKRMLGKKEGDVLIITTSRLVAKNGVDDLITSLRSLDAHVKLVILGTGPDEEKLKLLTKKYGLGARVRFLGHVALEDVPQYLAVSDIFCRPSRSEGFGSSFVEAMAAGVPVIATPVGGIVDFLFDPERNADKDPTGIFCAVDDPKSIAHAVRRFMDDRVLREKIVANAKRLVTEQYDWDLIARRMEGVYDGVMGERPERKRHVLVATGISAPDIGGPATYTKILAEEFPMHGIRIDVASFRDVRHLPKVVRHIVYFFTVLRAAKNTDVIFAQDPVSVGVPALCVASLLGKRFAVKVVGDYAWEQYRNANPDGADIEAFQKKLFCIITEVRRAAQRHVVQSADVVIVPSDYLKKIVAQWGVPAANITVIHNTFDAQFIPETKEEARAELGLSGTIIVSVGRLVPWKGFSALIESFVRVKKKYPDAKLIIIGSGPEQSRLEKDIAERELAGAVIMTGKLPPSELARYVRSADVFTLNTSYEGFSHQIVETMALGTPVVTTNVCGNPEIITHGNNGILVPFGDTKKLTDAIVRVCGDASFADVLVQNAKETVKKFSKETMIEKTIHTLGI